MSFAVGYLFHSSFKTMDTKQIDNSSLAATDRADFGGSRVLAKASRDPFIYAAGLRSGMIVQFERAVAGGEWVTLHGVSQVEPPITLPTGRGIEVRLADISWLIDAENSPL
jgi:hypothetical protein